jgi:phosphoribosyl 1,2-cyclic phosphodiesterase
VSERASNKRQAVPQKAKEGHLEKRKFFISNKFNKNKIQFYPKSKSHAKITQGKTAFPALRIKIQNCVGYAKKRRRKRAFLLEK